MSKYVMDTGMTLSQVSEKSGVPFSTVQEYLSAGKDVGRCSVKNFHAIATALDITMDSLFEKLAMGDVPEKENKYKGVKLPSEFKGIFWDRDFDCLDLDEETGFIIIRLFTHGGFKGVKYVEDTFAKEDIIRAVRTRRDLNPVVANFLKNRYGLKRSEMNYYAAVHDVGNDWR